MELGIVLLVIIIILWQLFVNGWIWKITLGIFGWLGMYWALSHYFPSSTGVCMTISGTSFSWAGVIPTAVLFMSMFYTND